MHREATLSNGARTTATTTRWTLSPRMSYQLSSTTPPSTFRRLMPNFVVICFTWGTGTAITLPAAAQSITTAGSARHAESRSSVLVQLVDNDASIEASRSPWFVARRGRGAYGRPESCSSTDGAAAVSNPLSAFNVARMVARSGVFRRMGQYCRIPRDRHALDMVVCFW